MSTQIQNTASQQITVADRNFPALMATWVEFLDVRPKSAETYARNIRPFAVYLSEHRISAPTRETVVAYRKSLFDAGMKPTTIQSYLCAVKRFFQWTAISGLYPDIAEHVKGCAIDTEHKKDALSADQARDVLRKVDTKTEAGLRDYAILSLMMTTGLRTVSVVAANIEDVRHTGSGAVLYYRGKGHDERSVYVKLVPNVENAITDYLSKRGETDGKAPLFASTANRNAGERMTTRSVSRIAKDHLVDAGFNSDRLTAHSLRHTAATLNLLNGGTVEETQQLLNHKSITTTMIYSHALERARNNSEGRIASAIFG